MPIGSVTIYGTNFPAGSTLWELFYWTQGMTQWGSDGMGWRVLTAPANFVDIELGSISLYPVFRDLSSPKQFGSYWLVENPILIFDVQTGSILPYTPPAAPPTVATVRAHGVRKNFAALYGDLLDLGGAELASVSFLWGLSPAQLLAETVPAEILELPNPFAFTLTGLSPNTTYYYRAKAVTANGETLGTIEAFTTPAAATVPPDLATTAVLAIGETTAIVEGILGAMGSTSEVDVYFEYGLSESYGHSTSAETELPFPNLLGSLEMTAPGFFSKEITGLTPGTWYFFRAIGEGDGSVYGDGMRFKTLSAIPNPPVISGIEVTGITENLAVISWFTDVPADSRVWYDIALGLWSERYEPALVTQRGLAVVGLVPDTLYYYKVESTNASGVTTVSDVYTFRTLPAAAPPVITDIQVTGITENLAIVNWLTDVPADSRVKYDIALGLWFEEYAPALVTQRGLAVVGLVPDTLYYYRVESTNADGVTATSDVYTFQTLPPAAIPNPPVISNIQETQITQVTASISWETDTLADSWVYYGEVDGVWEPVVYFAGLVNSRDIGLFGLKPGTVYYYYVGSTDAYNQTATSTVRSFTTLPIDPADVTIMSVTPYVIGR